MLCIPQEFFDTLSGRSNLQVAPPPPPSPVRKEPRRLTKAEREWMANHAAASKKGAAKAASETHGGQHHVDVAITLHDHDVSSFHGDHQKALLHAVHGHVDPDGHGHAVEIHQISQGSVIVVSLA